MNNKNSIISTNSLKYNIRYVYEIIKNIKSIRFDVDYNSKSYSTRRIIIFSHEMTKTGAPLLLLHIVKGLHSKGYNITVVSQCAGPLLKEFSEYSEVYICRKPSRFEKRLDKLIGLGVNTALINTVICGRWVKLLKRKDIHTVTLVHEMPNVIKAWKAENEAKDISLLSDMVVFPSMFVKEKFDELQENNFKFSILTQGIYLKPDSRLDKYQSYKRVKNRYFLNDKKIILNVASGNYRKGFDLFLKMAVSNNSYNYIWVGNYDKHILNNVCSKYKVSEIDNLRLLGYIDSPSDLNQLYSSASVLALTSREEPFGSIVLESMYAGTPVVAFKDAGGFKDVVINDKTGYLVEYENINEMMRKIEYLTSNEERYKCFSNESSLLVEDYSFDKYISKLIHLLSSKTLNVEK